MTGVHVGGCIGLALFVTPTAELPEQLEIYNSLYPTTVRSTENRDVHTWFLN